MTAVAALAALGAPSAQALTTLGQLAAANPPPVCSGGPGDIVQAVLSGGPSYVVPAPGGAITSWSTNAAAGAGQTLKLKVFRPVSASTYTVVAHDGPRALTPSTLNTFPTEIPVQTGDVIGLNDQNAPSAHNACLFATGAGDAFATGAPGDVADGSTEALGTIVGGYRLNLSAVLQQPPAVTEVQPPEGSIAGGTAMVITGHDLTGATSVTFGASAASSFTVNSDIQITAVAPPATTPGPVDIAVTTVAGTTSPASADRFTYVACVVPKLKGKSLKAARKALGRADCRLGKVRGKKGKRARVKKQSVKPRTVLPPGAKVGVRVGS